MPKPKTRSLKRRGADLSDPTEQRRVLQETETTAPRFEEKLTDSGLYPFKPTEIEILQLNVGYMCDLTCEHCHVDAGPDRKEVMTKQTMQYCLDAIDNSHIGTVDLTGGAPEMNPHFQWFVEEVSKRNVDTIVRSNLTILVSNKKFRQFPEFFRDHGVKVVASLPCYTADNTDKQRGDGVFDRSIEALQRLNELGYGKSSTGLELHLVFNPGGPGLPPDQASLEKDYKEHLAETYGIVFNDLYTITNLPISRFLEFLMASGRYEEYMEKLANAYNPKAAEGVMCRNTLSVGYDGRLFDCDFNQMLELGVEATAPQHIRDFRYRDLRDRNIVTGQHCYGCTAGAGSSCQGSIL